MVAMKSIKLSVMDMSWKDQNKQFSVVKNDRTHTVERRKYIHTHNLTAMFKYLCEYFLQHALLFAANQAATCVQKFRVQCGNSSIGGWCKDSEWMGHSWL